MRSLIVLFIVFFTGSVYTSSIDTLIKKLGWPQPNDQEKLLLHALQDLLDQTKDRAATVKCKTSDEQELIINGEHNNNIVQDIKKGNYECLKKWLYSIVSLTITYDKYDDQYDAGIVTEGHFSWLKYLKIKGIRGHEHYLKRCKLPTDSLQTLKLSHLLLKDMPDNTIPTCTHLTTLDLSGNRYSHLPSAFTQLQKLQLLNISHNKFKYCPDVLFSLRALTTLDLSYNSLQHIDISLLLPLRKLKIVKVIGNDALNKNSIKRKTEGLPFKVLTTLFNGDNCLDENIPQEEKKKSVVMPLTYFAAYAYYHSLDDPSRMKYEAKKNTTFASLPSITKRCLYNQIWVAGMFKKFFVHSLQKKNYWAAAAQLLDEAKRSEIFYTDVESPFFEVCHRINSCPEKDTCHKTCKEITKKLKQMNDDELEKSLKKTTLLHIEYSDDCSCALLRYGECNWIKNLSIKGRKEEEYELKKWMLYPFVDLEKLSLTQLALKEIPPHSLRTLMLLTTLDLRNNCLSTLPEDIGDSISLTCLDLRRNLFAEVPACIGALTQLTSLNLAHNTISHIPMELASLRNLKTFNVSHNNIKSLPLACAGMKSLTSLDVNTNAINWLLGSFEYLTGLTQLDLCKNPVTKLPEAITRLTSLTSLQLDEALIHSKENSSTVQEFLNKYGGKIRQSLVEEISANIKEHKTAYKHIKKKKESSYTKGKSLNYDPEQLIESSKNI